MADLSGTWLGTYWQLGHQTRFEVTFIQGGNTLTGNILDHSYLGEAALTGEVIGRRIQFLKRYLLKKQAPIKYEGTISEDQNFMQGTWQINRFESGTWEAHRRGESLTLEVGRSQANQAPA